MLLSVFKMLIFQTFEQATQEMVGMKLGEIEMYKVKTIYGRLIAPPHLLSSLLVVLLRQRDKSLLIGNLFSTFTYISKDFLSYSP